MKDINFFSYNINTVVSARRKKIILLAAIVGFFLLLGTIYGVTELRVMHLKQEIQESRDYLNSEEVARGKEELEQKKSELNLLKQYDEAITCIAANIDGSDKVRSELIEKINSTLPAGIKVASMSLSRENANISAEALSRTEIAELEHNLLETQLFSRVHIASIDNEDGRGSFSFSADCTLKDVIEK